MGRLAVLSTRIQPGTKKALALLCKTRGLKMSVVVEQALLEKIEDLDDSYELASAVSVAEEMIPYRLARRALKTDGVI